MLMTRIVFLLLVMLTFVLPCCYCRFVTGGAVGNHVFCGSWGILMRLKILLRAIFVVLNELPEIKAMPYLQKSFSDLKQLFSVSGKFAIADSPV